MTRLDDDRSPNVASFRRVDAEQLERLFSYARQDGFHPSRKQAMLVTLCADIRRMWDRYEKIR